MKNIRLIALITAFMLPLFTSCVEEAPEVSVEFAGATYQLNVGGTLDLSAELKVGNSSQKPQWESSAEAVASVDASGMVTGLSAGEASVKAIVEGKEAVCSIVVKDVLAESIVLTAPKTLTADGFWTEIKAQVQPAGFNPENLVWTFTPSAEALAFESERVNASSYKVRFNAFVEGGSLSIKVADRNSDVSQTVSIAAAEKVVSASKITLNMPEELTGGGIWAAITAVTEPAEYDAGHLVWEFEPSDEALGFRYEKISAAEYRVCFAEYISGGSVLVKVSDELSATFNQGRIKVLEKENIDFSIELTPEDSGILKKGLQQDKSVRMKAVYKRTQDGKDYVPATTSWKSSDSSVATVDSEGNVTAVIEHIDESGIDNGKKVTITHIADGKEKAIEIVVVKALPEQVIMTAVPSVEGVDYRMLHGDTFTFKAKVLPEKARQDVWFAGGEYLQLPNNTFTATTVGKVDFMAYASDNTEARLSFTIDVLPIALTDMSLSNTTLDMAVGAQASLTAVFTPSDASYRTLTWSSSDENVVTVDSNGGVIAVGTGSAVITATQAENNISRTCTVTVTEPVVTYNIGDYYYSTGKVSSKPDEDEAAYGKVIGVIFSTDDPSQQGDTKLAADYPDCTHGYVLSLAEYTEKDFGAVSTFDGHKYYTDLGFDANLIVAQDKANGYNNTLAHTALNASKSDYCLIFNQTDGVVATQSASVPTPPAASAWYVPSYKEMQMINANRTVINAALAAVGGVSVAEPHESDHDLDEQRSSDWYWTSTIYGDWYERGKSYDHHKYPFDISRDGWTAKVQSSAACRARVVLAF